MDTETLRRENATLLARLQQGQVWMKNWLNSHAQNPTVHQHSTSTHPQFVKHVDKTLNRTGERSPRMFAENVDTRDKTPVKVRFIDQKSFDDSRTSTSLQSSASPISTMTNVNRDIYSSPVANHTIPSRRTPKSVLKGRNIIDRNVKLDSEMGDWDHFQPTSRLQLLEMLNKDNLEGNQRKTDNDFDVSNLYYSSGNQRPDKLSTRTALHPFPDDNTGQPISGTSRNVQKLPQYRPTTNSLSSTISSKNTSQSSDKSSYNPDWRTVENILRSEGERPLLGYDWIAADLDNSQDVAELSDSFFEDIKKFRSRNKTHCEDRYGTENLYRFFSKSPSPVKQLSHTCVHGYVLNDRLYPEPINSDEEGNSVCPVCLVERPTPTVESPGFVRVSIPKNSLVSPYTVKPHRRKSFDCADAVSLSSHCMVGWESSKPSALPPASTMDLREAVDGITEKLVTDVEAEKNIINSLASVGKRLTSYHGREKNLDMHRSLLFELENQIRKDK